MFKININFSGQKPPKAPYSRMSIDEIYGYLLWEAELTATYNNQIISTQGPSFNKAHTVCTSGTSFSETGLF